MIKLLSEYLGKEVHTYEYVQYINPKLGAREPFYKGFNAEMTKEYRVNLSDLLVFIYNKK